MLTFDHPEELIHWLGQRLKKEQPQSKMSAGIVRVYDHLIEELMMFYGSTAFWEHERLGILLHTAAEDPRPVHCSQKIIGFIVEIFAEAEEDGLNLEDVIRIMFEFLDVDEDELRIVKSGGERYVVSTP